MAGLDLITRKSLERGSLSSILINENIQRVDEVESKNWSWNALQEQFRLKKSEGLFRKYQARLQHSLFMLSLMINALNGFISIVIISSLYKDEGKLTAPLVTKGAGFAVTLAIFVMSYRESWFRSDMARIGASLFMLLAMVTSVYGGSLYYALRHRDDIQEVRIPSNVLIAVFLFLPFPRMYQAVLAGAAVIALELTLVGMDKAASSVAGGRRTLSRQIAADAVFHVTVAIACLYIRFLMEFINRRAFLDKRECFESKFHLEYEKEQEEQLLLSILPKHISGKVRQDIREAIRRIDQELILQERPFTDLYVERHRDVSILYADIVNSMLLTTSLRVSELVETLNELFGRFDECAERNNCMRIKLLGDCYYCVSGMPNRDPQHADNCVQMGLSMIEMIGTFRKESNVDVDMRIGVHSGSVLSGLLGLRKWQFDIWSRDVTIASRMEQTGKPGCVHISSRTKDSLHRQYTIKPAYRDLPDANRNNSEMETFLITPNIKSQVQKSPMPSTRSFSSYHRRHSTNSVVTLNKHTNKTTRRASVMTEVLSSRRRTVLGSSLMQYRKMVTQVNQFMERVIDSMALSKTDKWFRSEGIQPLVLTFRQMLLEKPYLAQPDLLFKYYPLCVLLLFVGMATIRILTMPQVKYLWILYLTISIVIVASCLGCWVGYLWDKYVSPVDENSFFSTSTAAKISKLLNNNVIVRMLLTFTISALLLSSSMIGLNICEDNILSLQGNDTKNITEDEPLACVNPWYFTFSAVLALMATSVFLRVHYFLKLIVNMTSLLIFVSVISTDCSDVYENGKVRFVDWKWLSIHPVAEHCWCLGMTWFTLHLLDRQVEYICRLDYLWKRRLGEEQEETRTMALVNRTLLQNILPVHVAQYYLVQESMHLEVDLYHEEYTSVAVMFASIPNFMDFYSETVMNDEGLRCLQVLHEIICDFDKLLYDASFQKIEKIKTVGSTYMAAAGLQPGRNSSRSSYENMKIEEDPIQNVILLIEFATSMMHTLQDMNVSTWQDFKLRVGISVGPVIAGVVGVTKPQYDIWGDTVNLASRMDTTGVVDCIQVTEPAAAILAKNSRYQCECRGEIFVKGKGWMTTYLVYPQEVTRL